MRKQLSFKLLSSVPPVNSHGSSFTALRIHLAESMIMKQNQQVAGNGFYLQSQIKGARSLRKLRPLQKGLLPTAKVSFGAHINVMYPTPAEPCIPIPFACLHEPDC